MFLGWFFLIVRITGVWFEGKNGSNPTGHVDVDKFLDATNMESECAGGFLDLWGHVFRRCMKVFQPGTIDFFKGVPPSILEKHPYSDTS